MSYLVRKIERAKWAGSEKIGARIKADVVASCIRPMASELSVWYAKDEQDLDDARLAMLAATNKPATIDFVEIPLSVVQEAGLKVVESLPTVGPEALKSRHRDIADLDLDSLQTVAKIIQRLLSEDKAKRLTAGQCKTMLKQAIANNRFSANELAEGISSKL